MTKFIRQMFLIGMVLAFSILSLNAQVPPTLLTPANNDSCVSKEVTLSWDAVPNAVYYRVEVSDKIDFSSLIINQTNLQGTNLNIIVDNWQTNYYWRVYSVFSGGQQGKSAEWMFKTKRPVVNLIAPADLLECANISQQFSWHKAEAEFYHLQVAKDSLFTDLVVNRNNLADTTFITDVAVYLKKFYWRVAALKGVCKTDWSAVRVFTTKQSPPNQIYPAKGALGGNIFSSAPFNLTFKWNKQSGADSYDFQLSRKSDFSTLFSEFNGLTDTTLAVDLGTRYDSVFYWRIRSVSGTCTSDWSTAFNFKTPYSSPNLTVPLNDEQCITQINTLFKWNSVAGAARYTLQISDTVSFTRNLIELTDITETLFNITLGAPLKKHFWRVRGEDNLNSGLWSQVFNFTTTQRPPANRLPANGSVGFEKKLTLSWENLGAGTTYDIKLYDDQELSSLILDSVMYASNTLIVDVPDNNKTYYWIVRARSSGCIGDWSNVISFKTILPPPVLMLPEDNSVVATLTPIYTWIVVDDAESYDIEVSLDSTFKTIYKSEKKIKSNQWTFAGEKFQEETIYFWRVRAVNSEGRSNWSNHFKFTTQQVAEEPPALIYPVNAQVKLPLEVDLLWKKMPKAITYQLQVSESSNYGELLVSEELTDTTYKLVGLNLYKAYFWRVRSVNKGGPGNWSTSYSFRTKDLAPEAPVALSYPEDNAINLPISFTFRWNSVPRALGYELVIATSSNFEESSIAQKYDKVWDVSKLISSLEYNKTYYWRVRAWNEDGQAPWSPVRSFKTLISSSVNDKQDVTAANVYPNPVEKNKLNINFELNTPNYVTIKVFNLLGKEVLNLAPKFYGFGNNSVELITNDLKPGIYIYSIHAGNNTINGRFIVSE